VINRTVMKQNIEKIKGLIESNRPRFVLFTSLLCILVISLTSIALSLGTDGLNKFKQVSVTHHDIEQNVLGRGIVEPTEVASVVSELPRDRATIIWMADEGLMVEQGDLIARFDPQVTQNKLDETNNELVAAKVKLLNATKSLELRQKEQKSEMESASNSKEITLLSAKDVKYGSGALQKEKLQQRIVQLERKLSLVNLENADYQIIFKKGHISQRELDRSLNQLQEAKEELGFGKEEYANFETYVWPKLLRESELLAEKAHKDFDRAIEKSQLELTKLKEEVAVTQANVLRKTGQVNILTNQLGQCNVRAPISGMLLYKKVKKNGGRRHYKIGDKVWKGQTLFEIPNTNDLMINSRVRELDISKVKIGQTVRIKIDALPNRQVLGKVSHIRRYAEESAESSDQLFSVHVRIAEKIELLVGMSALVEISIASLNQALSVPYDAVFYQDNSAFVRVGESDEFETRQVDIGLKGAQWVQVLSGLTLNEAVLVEQF